jgi:hypothetical protein
MRFEDCTSPETKIKYMTDGMWEFIDEACLLYVGVNKRGGIYEAASFFCFESRHFSRKKNVCWVWVKHLYLVPTGYLKPDIFSFFYFIIKKNDNLLMSNRDKTLI